MDQKTKKTVGVILCGAGYKDGSEIRESVAVLWALSHHQVEIQCFAPDAPQRDVVNCLTGQIIPNESRNMLVESARIARGKIQSLDHCDVNTLDALILPGGSGAAKNLCDFAFKGSHAKIRSDVLRAIGGMHAQQKPIGAVCISPAIVAVALKGKGLKLTVGESGETAKEIEKLGHRHEVCGVTECVVDPVHRIVTTPAYMIESAPLHHIFLGIQKCVDETLKFII